ncbi:MAG: small, acid-soluble spore protein, alpha/beta type [Christensenellales bacterium]
MAASNSNQTLVPQAKQLLNTMKYEVASEIGVNLKQGYNGDISAREAGRVGGNMVKKMIQYAESSMSGGKF